jgi:hypothetical protein
MQERSQSITLCYLKINLLKSTSMIVFTSFSKYNYFKPITLLLLPAVLLINSCTGDVEVEFSWDSVKAGNIHLVEGITTTGVPVNAEFSATFTKDLSGPIFTSGSGCISLIQVNQGIEMSSSGSGKTVFAFPVSSGSSRIDLESNKTYTLTIGCITSINGETMPPVVRTFTTQ